jgi:DNA helicase IV
MVARRSRRGSMTILGDLAQATAPGHQTSWRDALAVIGARDPHLDELTVGYRVPAPIIDFANRLLPSAAPTVAPTRSVRERGHAPRIVPVSAGECVGAVAREVAELAATWNTLGVVVPARLFDEVAAALGAAELSFTDARRASELDEHITLLPAIASKGLEFDAVLVVEPVAVVEEEGATGVRALYVALTRAVQALTIVHADPLPNELRAH